MLLGWRHRLPAWPLYLGCLLPDLIDKPLYYGIGQTALLAGTRTFGHTGIFLLATLACALVARRPAVTAVAAGVATHFALDICGELVTGADPESSIWLAFFWPAYAARFPVAHFRNLIEHMEVSAQSAYVVVGELIGGAILLTAWIKRLRSRRA